MALLRSSGRSVASVARRPPGGVGVRPARLRVPLMPSAGFPGGLARATPLRSPVSELRPAEVRVPVQSIARYEDLIGGDDYARRLEVLSGAVSRLSGRVVWHVNSTARGGGVAEMMGPLIGAARGLGVDARWLVIAGTPDFFSITKRLHNLLHGWPGDGGALGEAERRAYEEVLAANAVELQALVRRGDLVVLHDPQTAGLVPAMRRSGATVVWRCHVGRDDPDGLRVGAARLELPRAVPARGATRRSSPGASSSRPAATRDGRA